MQPAAVAFKKRGSAGLWLSPRILFRAEPLQQSVAHGLVAADARDVPSQVILP